MKKPQRPELRLAAKTATPIRRGGHSYDDLTMEGALYCIEWAFNDLEGDTEAANRSLEKAKVIANIMNRQRSGNTRSLSPVEDN